MYELTIALTDFVAHGPGAAAALALMAAGAVALICSYGLAND